MSRDAPEWGSDIAWRQGSVLASGDLKLLGLEDPEETGQRVVLLASHDCDIVCEIGKEPLIEVVVGTVIAKGNGNNTHAKVARCLHISLLNSSGQEVWVEIPARSKHSIEKGRFCSIAPDPDLKLSASGLRTFQIWLASRYQRDAFPDNFNNCLGRTRLADKLRKLVEPCNDDILAILFDLDDGENVERTEDDPYVLDIYLVVEGQKGDINKVSGVVASIVEAFRSKLCPDGRWTGIELGRCEVYSDEALPYAAFRRMKVWRLDHLSLRANPRTDVPKL